MVRYGKLVTLIFKICVVLVAHKISKVSASPLNQLFGGEDHSCKNVNISDWMFLPNSRCFQILFEANASDATCRSAIFHQLVDTAVIIKSFSQMKNRNIAQQNKSNCESFLILSSNHRAISNLFTSTSTATDERKFFPFSRLYFMLPSDTNLTTLQSHLYFNALFGYNLIREGRTDKIVSLYDLLSKTYRQHTPNDTDLSHPFINTTDPSKEFTISVFNCTPSVTYLERIGNDYR